MNQVWNIFRKDVRHHWPEIAASLALLVAFAWFDIRSWSRFDGAMATGAAAAVSFFFTAQMLPGLVNFLLPVSWIFLIVRVVQSESLVGDRQFWVTRPYDWKQLLAAKALFALAFTNFPLLCMHVFLLAHAGFHPSRYIAGLLWLQVMWILIVFLWITALATVTKSIAQMLLALLLIVLNIIGASALSSVIHKSDLYGSFDLWWGLVVIIAAVAIVLLQYSCRRTALSRWSIVGVCAVLTVISVGSSQPTPDRASIVRQYPPSTGGLPLQLGLMRTDTYEGQLSPLYNNEVSIQLPVSVTGIPENSFLRLDGMIVTLATANGFLWDSGWKANSQWLFSDHKTAQLYFQIRQSIFDQLSSGPVTADFFLAFTLYQDKSRREFVVPSGGFRLLDIGWCTTEDQYSRGIHCLAPLRKPAFLLVTSETAASTCLPENSSPSAVVRAFVQGYPGRAEIGISPVRPFDIAFSDWDWFARRPVSSGICPGTPLTLSNPEETGRRGIELQIKDLHLDDFRERSPAVP